MELVTTEKIIRILSRRLRSTPSQIDGILLFKSLFMAENKKSFVLYSDSQGLINQLPDEVAGQLLKHIFAYVNDENPQTDNLLLKIAFEPIKMQLKRDLVKYEDKKEQWSEAGKKSAEARRLKKEQEAQQNSTNSTSVDFIQHISTDSTVVNSVATVSTVSVNDNVNVNDIKVNNDLSVNWDALLNQFNSITGKHQKVVDDKVKRQVMARLKSGYSKNDIVTAITNCFNDPYHIENPKYLTLEFISRPDKMATYSQDITTPKKPIKQQERL